MSGMFETFGKYRLTERLAFGGMAEVFLATVHGEAGFMKPVVIKRLHPRLNEDAEFVQMLIDEARITAQLTHTNICQVLDLGSVEGSYYLAMEFISGEDLRTMQDQCNRTGIPLPAEAAVFVMTEVLAGLDYAHRREGPDGQPMAITHRDISPQNILISYEGEVKIIDFGIAKARLRLVKTEAGVIKGKFRYMSPEQAVGGQVDYRTDVFAAGVVLYELLRGEPHSLNVPDTEVLRRMRKAEFEPLRKIRPSVPTALDKAVRKALAQRPQHRFQTAGAFREALMDFLDRTGRRFGRTDLAALMQTVFDADRRRRRSGSLSGRTLPATDAMPAMPRHAAAQTPAAGLDDEGTTEEMQRRASMQRADPQDPWVAFAPTSASLPGELPDTAPLDALSTEALEALPTTDLALPPVADSGVSDDAATRAYYAVARDSVPVAEDPSIPTVVPGRPRPAGPVQPELTPPTHLELQRRRAGPIRPEHTPPTQIEMQRGSARPAQLHREPTDILAQAAPPPAAPSPQPAPPPSLGQPTVSTGFFAREAETVTKDRQRQSAHRPAAVRTLLGLAAVVVFGGVLALALYLMERPLDLPDDPDTVGGPVVLLPDLEPAADAGSAPVHRTRRGVIHVRSHPAGAEITLCGEFTGKTTPARVQAEVGRSCELELELEGYDRYQISVTAERNHPVNVVATLRRRRRRAGGGGGGGGAAHGPRSGRGTLRVTSIQVGTVYVDNKAVGTTPRLDLELSPGTYSVKVYFQSQDQYSKVRTVTVRPGATTRVHLDPSP